MEIQESLSYDDVLLLPGYSEVLPREVRTTSRLTRALTLNVPIISAAMDTVTESEMAIALALQGGAGVIHRNLSPELQADEVLKVKRFLNWIIENPVTIEEDRTLRDVWAIMERKKVSGLPVINKDGVLVGIITSRDLRFRKDETSLVRDVMTRDPVICHGAPSVEEARKQFDTHKIEKLPIVDAHGKLQGMVTVKDMEKHELYPNAALDASGKLLVGAAVSPQDFEIRIPLLLDARCDFVALDTAHGDSKNVIDAVKAIKKRYPIQVIAGNVATKEGTRRLIDAGADAIKVGIGPGSICTTRIVAGIGVAQFSAVYDCAEEADKSNIPVIADGGIKYSGDITKAIGAGASTVMIGNLFAGLKEAPGKEIIFDGRIYKAYRGMGSLGALQDGAGDRYQIGKDETPVPEGIEGRVPYKGELKDFLHQLIAGLKKGMGYTGCKTIDELRQYRRFVKISPAGLRESHAHDITITQEAPNYSKQ
ncbi:MAG TPA: IMP dehydrogenase [Spirochaetia bacterium]|nr:IMP dehydrogenase [Spirochaetales bacterium]HOT58555.1 IMP dehydrogenase [Spirochaetales bacterium]HPD80270.1 IMP dehydrogenase [Spirochaetales bacterium]HRS65707.1 IMP dehydrogenase [Spirochaetia bacterium]HRV27223.1 IMP dehydrogenase [Spirochaetia bacterium]